jgi:hypothetical protein
MTAQTDTTTNITAARPRRADTGTVRLSQRDIDGLMLAGEHYGTPLASRCSPPTSPSA